MISTRVFNPRPYAQTQCTRSYVTFWLERISSWSFSLADDPGPIRGPARCSRLLAVQFADDHTPYKLVLSGSKMMVFLRFQPIPPPRGTELSLRQSRTIWAQMCNCNCGMTRHLRETRAKEAKDTRITCNNVVVVSRILMDVSNSALSTISEGCSVFRYSATMQYLDTTQYLDTRCCRRHMPYATYMTDSNARTHEHEHTHVLRYATHSTYIVNHS